MVESDDEECPNGLEESSDEEGKPVRNTQKHRHTRIAHNGWGSPKWVRCSPFFLF